jgi:hypothetical protein
VHTQGSKKNKSYHTNTKDAEMNKNAHTERGGEDERERDEFKKDLLVIACLVNCKSTASAQRPKIQV